MTKTTDTIMAYGIARAGFWIGFGLAVLGIGGCAGATEIAYALRVVVEAGS